MARKRYKEIMDPEAARKIARGEHVHALDIKPPARVQIDEGDNDYAEELMQEWTDGHAAEQAPDDGSEQVPQWVQDRYAELEQETALRILEANKAEIERLEPMVRVDVVAKKAAYEVGMYGHITEDTKAEMLELGLDPEELGVPTQ